ncbi:MAG: GNAT family N-acetyltransferase [Duganella sp.]
MEKLKLTALGKAHDIAAFHCGVEELNQWLRTTARQHAKHGTSKTYVLVSGAQPSKILGFVAIALRKPILSDELPPEMSKRLPSVVHGYTLARLAVSVDAQGQGIGRRLLLEGMEKTYHAAKLVGGYALFVDAKEGATSFYEKYGFRLFKEEPDILVLPFDSFPPFPEQPS